MYCLSLGTLVASFAFNVERAHVPSLYPEDLRRGLAAWIGLEKFVGNALGSVMNR